MDHDDPVMLQPRGEADLTKDLGHNVEVNGTVDAVEAAADAESAKTSTQAPAGPRERRLAVARPAF